MTTYLGDLLGDKKRGKMVWLPLKKGKKKFSFHILRDGKKPLSLRGEGGKKGEKERSRELPEKKKKGEDRKLHFSLFALGSQTTRGRKKKKEGEKRYPLRAQGEKKGKGIYALTSNEKRHND